MSTAAATAAITTDVALEEYRKHCVKCMIGYLDEYGHLPAMSDRAIQALRDHMKDQLDLCQTKDEVIKELQDHGETAEFRQRTEASWAKTEFAPYL